MLFQPQGYRAPRGHSTILNNHSWSTMVGPFIVAVTPIATHWHALCQDCSVGDAWTDPHPEAKSESADEGAVRGRLAPGQPTDHGHLPGSFQISESVSSTPVPRVSRLGY